jgi:hypothetical protein
MNIDDPGFGLTAQPGATIAPLFAAQPMPNISPSHALHPPVPRCHPLPIFPQKAFDDLLE